MNVFLTADWHLGCERLKIMRRPFASTEEMHQHLIAAHNSLVQPEDLVLHIGDVCEKGDVSALSYVGSFNGRKWLFRGNHDREINDEQFAPYFEKIYPENMIVGTMIGDLALSINHYPTKATTECFHLCGHIHDMWRLQYNAFNCGVDANHFLPTNLEEVPGILASIQSFFDEDAWAAYHVANALFRGKRGKAGSYNMDPSDYTYTELR